MWKRKKSQYYSYVVTLVFKPFFIQLLRKLYRQVTHYAAPSYHMQKLKQALEDAMNRQNPDSQSMA
ncbi:hypothetical protein AHF37_12411 [Paragonimus kellicotti]|nr:hypothetical protein AHF37_12411 [Paragonimus kellicotti]